MGMSTLGSPSLLRPWRTAAGAEVSYEDLGERGGVEVAWSRYSASLWLNLARSGRVADGGISITRGSRAADLATRAS